MIGRPWIIRNMNVNGYQADYEDPFSVFNDTWKELVVTELLVTCQLVHLSFILNLSIKGDYDNSPPLRMYLGKHPR